jgi:ribosome-associated translation inhibitor RaiA
MPAGRVTRRIVMPLIPTYIRLAGVRVEKDARSYVRRKLRSRLAKFGASVERISVRMEDLNGPRGGVDQVCRIKVVLKGLPSIVVERRGDTLEAAVEGAVDGVERTVRRRLQRRRTAPIKRRTRS